MQPLEEALREARPSWSQADLLKAQAKLEKVGIWSTLDLLEALSSNGGRELNTRLKDAGEKAFSADTLQQLRSHLLHAKPAESLLGATTVPESVNPRLESASPDRIHANSTVRKKLPWHNERADPQGIVEVHKQRTENITSRNTVATEEKNQQKLNYESIPDLDTLLSQLDLEEEQEFEEKQRHRRQRDAHAPTLDEIAVEENIEAKQLAEPGRFRELLEQLAELKTMTASRLQSEYSKRGFAAFEAMSRQELIPLLKDAITCEFLRFPDLRERCRKHGLTVSSAQPRSEVMQLLADSSWESIGVPVTRLPSLNVARDVLNKIVDLDTCDLQDLVARCRKLNLPEPNSGSRDVMKQQMKQAIVWMHLSAEELRYDSQALQVEVEIDSTLAEHEIRLALFHQLVRTMQSDRLAKLGIRPVSLSQEEEVKRKLNQLQIMGRLSLHSELRKHHVPFDPKAGRQLLANQLRDIIVWKELRVDDLKKECLKNGLDAIGTRLVLIESLLKRQATLIELETRGIPVKRIPDMKILMELAAKFDFFEVRSKEELLDFYLDMGLPPERCLERSELLDFFKRVSCWSAMPLEMLEEEAIKYKLPACKPADGKKKDEHERRLELTDKLWQSERKVTWESRGYFSASTIEKFEDVVQLLHQAERLYDMSSSERKDAYKSTGLPMGNGSEDYWMLLKSVIQWEAMQMPDLHKVCDHRGIRKPQTIVGMDEERAKSFMITMFIVDLLKESYTQKGLLVERLGLEDATILVGRFDSFESSTVEELIEVVQQMGSVAPPRLEKEKLVSFVQHFAGWGALKIDGLWKTCESRGIPMNGFDRTETADELRERLMSRLLLQLRASLAEASESNAASKEKSASHTGNVRRYIEIMRDPVMAERFCEIPAKPIVEKLDLPEDASSWSALETALYVLSSGKMNPSIERRLQGEYSKELISVVCPTSERRQNFHPLLYENFTRQKHEPKELVVVDTGTTPSTFFLEKAREDSRIIYRHFVVDDSSTEQHVNKVERRHEVAWSLGLKRNIACYIARGTAIAQFDDDDLYSCDYLTWMWSKLKEAAQQNGCVGLDIGPAAAKLVAWHLLDISSLSFGYLDVPNDTSVPVRDRRGWLYGWGFSYVFSREAWELSPFPDVEFAEDSGFYEGLMVRGVPVALVPYPAASKETGLVAHSHHARSTSGGSAVFANGKRDVWNKSQAIPKNFLPLMPLVTKVHRDARWDSSSLRIDRQRLGLEKPGMDVSEMKLSEWGALSPPMKNGATGAATGKPSLFPKQSHLNSKGQKGGFNLKHALGSKQPWQFKAQGPLPTLGQSLAPKKPSLLASIGKGKGAGKGQKFPLTAGKAGQQVGDRM